METLFILIYEYNFGCLKFGYFLWSLSEFMLGYLIETEMRCYQFCFLRHYEQIS